LLLGTAELFRRTSAFIDRQVDVATDEIAAAAQPRAPHFEQACDHALRDIASDGIVSIIAVNIDYFDAVTASHGIDIAQEIAETVAELISEAVRPEDAITRYRDDGYAVLWAPTAEAPSVTEIANRIANKFDQPIETAAGHLSITASIGIASVNGADSATTSAPMLQRQAQWSARSAQRGGRAQLTIFDHSVQDQAIKSYETERKLRLALRDRQLEVAYQPILNLHSGEVVGVEALARWNDDVLGSISPTTFIPIAEESGLIGELGLLVLEMALAQGSTWNRNNGSSSLLAINLSNHQLLDPELIPAVEALLGENLFDPRNLCFEITESVVMSDVAASMTILGHLKDLGLCLAIDDFGTGYSSLSYLRQLPVDILKIDKSFVQAVYNRDDRVVTKAIIDLAHTLGMTTVAEGVETNLQVEVLHALNCDMAQGFYMHRPTPPGQLDFSAFDFGSAASTESHGLLSAPAATTGTNARQ